MKREHLYKKRWTGKAWVANVLLPNGTWTTRQVKKHFRLTVNDGVFADKIFTQIVNDIWQGHDQGTHKADGKAVVKPRLTLRDIATPFMDYAQADDSIKQATVDNYKTFLDNWILTTGKKPHLPIDHLNLEDELEAGNIIEWVSSLEILKPSSKLTALDTVNKILTVARVKKWVSRAFINPFTEPELIAFRKQLAATKRRDRNDMGNITIPLDYISTLVQEPGGNSKRQMLYQLAYYMGGRLGELMALTWGDIDFEAKTIHVNKQLLRIGQGPGIPVWKTSKAEIAANPHQALFDLPKLESIRYIPLHPDLEEALVAWKALYFSQSGKEPGPDLPILCRGKHQTRTRANSPNSEPHTFTWIDGPIELRKDLKRNNLPETDKRGYRLTFHAFRRTCATQLTHTVKAVPGVVKLVLGHSFSGDVTEAHYSSLNPREIETAEVSRPYLNAIPSLKKSDN